MAMREKLVEYAVSQGLNPDEADELTEDELVDLYGDPDADYQDQGSLDQPVQSTRPTEAAGGVGTEELREEARRVVTGKNRSRAPFPWEAPPPRRG